MKFSIRQQILYFGLAPFFLVIFLTLVQIPAVQFIAIILLYLLAFSWYCYLLLLWIRWIARTAEKAGRSYVGFMIFGIFMPPIASIVVLTFKQDKVFTPEKSADTEE